MYPPHIKKQDYVPRPPQMEYTRFPWAANEPPRAPLCGVSSRPLFPQDKESFFEIHRTQNKLLSFSRSLAYSICWLRYTDLKHYLVDWNERRRLLGLRLLDPPKTFAGIANGLRWDERQCSPM